MTDSVSDAQVIVYGARGHGKVVADILLARGIKIEGIVDDDPLSPQKVLGLKVLGDGDWLIQRAAHQPTAVALGIGDNFARRRIMERCRGAGVPLLIAVHPAATVAPSAELSCGSVVMAHAVVNADAAIGQGAIINTGAIVEHDCRVGDFAHLSPGVAMGGGSEVGDLSWLGIGSVLIHGIKVGSGSIIGAGATVVRDIGDWVIAVGTPAHVLRTIRPQT